MIEKDLFLIGERSGFTPQVGHLVSMLNYVRATTVSEVEELDADAFDYLHDRQSNSIGALLSHIAAVETWYQAETFFNRELDAEEMREWGAALDLGEAARRVIRGHGPDYYLGKLELVRAQTLEELGRRGDEWLEEQRPWGGRRANNYFKWFHVMEDELSHRGQIRWLRKRATRRPAP